MKFEVEMRSLEGHVRVVTVPDLTVEKYAHDIGKMIGVIMACGSMGRKEPVFAGDIVRYQGKRYLLKFQGFVELKEEEQLQ